TADGRARALPTVDRLQPSRPMADWRNTRIPHERIARPASYLTPVKPSHQRLKSRDGRIVTNVTRDIWCIESSAMKERVRRWSSGVRLQTYLGIHPQGARTQSCLS